MGEAADLLHLRQVLMAECETVDSGRAEPFSPLRRLIVRDHLFAAARVAGQREAGKGIVRRNDPHTEQGCRAGNEPGGMTAGVGDAAAGADRFALRRGELREAVGPVIACPVRRGSIDHAYLGVVDQGDGFSCSVVRQA